LNALIHTSPDASGNAAEAVYIEDKVGIALEVNQVVIETNEEALALEAIRMRLNWEELALAGIFWHGRDDELARIDVARTTCESFFVVDFTSVAPEIDSLSKHAHEVVAAVVWIPSDEKGFVLASTRGAASNYGEEKNDACSVLKKFNDIFSNFIINADFLIFEIWDSFFKF
jgi:hypothetical protein